MKVVYAIKVVVLGVPSEHGLPLADVHVRIGHTRNVLICQALVEQRLQLTEGPRNVLVEERSRYICTVQRRVVEQRLPEKVLNLLPVFSFRYFLELNSIGLEPLDTPADLLDQCQLINAL